MDVELIYPEECHAIIGACFEVYNVMGCGFLESVYQKCLEREFTMRGILFVAQQRIGLIYKGVALNQDFTSDFVCYEKKLLRSRPFQS